MELFKYMQKHNHEEIVFWSGKHSGLKAIVAIHSTVLGPALGGTRVWPYKTEEEAILDVLRLSEGMTYKASVAGLNLGGGKAVIIGDPAKDKSEALFRSFGRFVESLNGKYITAEDVGTTVEDMTYVHQETRHVVGLPTSEKGSGDPSPLTAFGVYRGMQACCRALFGSDSLSGARVAIQGLGKVGCSLARRLIRAGATVIAAEIDSQRLARLCVELGIEPVEADQIFDVDCDIFAPCALGAVINDDTIRQLRCKIIAGAANNQLARDRHGFELNERNILYAPDYVINAGGLISVTTELGAYGPDEAWNKTAAIYDAILRVIDLAREEDIPTHIAAHRLAQARIEMEKHKWDMSQADKRQPPLKLVK
jgi:leucine dehydrogenase